MMAPGQCRGMQDHPSSSFPRHPTIGANQQAHRWSFRQDMFGILARSLRNYLWSRELAVHVVKVQHINGEQSWERGGARVMCNDDGDWNKPEGSDAWSAQGHIFSTRR